MTATLLPIWPLIAGVIVLAGAALFLFLTVTSSHRRGWCLDCSMACDDELACVCCRRQTAGLTAGASPDDRRG